MVTFAGAEPRSVDVTIAKNYLDDDELRRLNMLVSAYFDAAEFRAQNRQPTYMADWVRHLDRLIEAMEATTLAGPGSVSHANAVSKARAEYVEYRKRRQDLPTDVEQAYLGALRQVARRTKELGE